VRHLACGENGHLMVSLWWFNSAFLCPTIFRQCLALAINVGIDFGSYSPNSKRNEMSSVPEQIFKLQSVLTFELKRNQLNNVCYVVFPFLFCLKESFSNLYCSSSKVKKMREGERRKLTFLLSWCTESLDTVFVGKRIFFSHRNTILTGKPNNFRFRRKKRTNKTTCQTFKMSYFFHYYIIRMVFYRAHCTLHVNIYMFSHQTANIAPTKRKHWNGFDCTLGNIAICT